jgi:hypothetical protein
MENCQFIVPALERKGRLRLLALFRASNFKFNPPTNIKNVVDFTVLIVLPLENDQKMSF